MIGRKRFVEDLFTITGSSIMITLYNNFYVRDSVLLNKTVIRLTLARKTVI